MSAISNAFEKMLLKSAQAVSFFNYPSSFEKLEIDDNHSVWASYTPDYQPGPPLKENITADLAIIGGGFTGTSTAYHFSRRYPEKRVVLLEAKSLANGASGRNGGMMLNWIYGTPTNVSDDIVQKIYKTTSDAMDMIEGIIEEHNLEVDYRRDGSLHVLTKHKNAEEAHAEVEQLNKLGIPLQYLDRASLRGEIELDGVIGATLDPTAGEINGAQLVRGLRPVLVEQGVEIYEQTPVTKIIEGREIELTTPHGTVRAKAIVLATNGYTGKLGYFRKALFPLHSHVFATAPLSVDEQKSIGWHTTSGYSDDVNRISYSSLTPDGRIVFGGGSNQSYAYLYNNRTAFPGTPDGARRGFEQMRQTMSDYNPRTTHLPVTHRWTGTLGISLRRNCSMGVRGEYRNIYYSIGYNGHGVTLANLSGKILTDIYSGDDEYWRDLPLYETEFTPIPMEPFRWIGYQTFTHVFGRSPRVE
ncbi:MAG: FAD-binding oxidoreductase [Chloroflexi bacterium]|nr:FAD-binding oxidoreductase [Chloroflexota bacterium]